VTGRPGSETTASRVVPIRQFVLKVHSRCNLRCNSCYVYELADQSWRDQPRVMTPATARQVAARIAEHAGAHGLRDVWVVLHGGEPLLAGIRRLAELIEAVRAGAGTTVHLSVQTNGILLDETVLALCERYSVRVGVSLDGDEAGNDRHRRYRDGRGSYADAARGLDLLGSPRWRPLFGGILCTVDVVNDPVGTYEALLRFAPPMIDLLLPHATWEHPPPSATPGGSPYADWLIAIFDRWYGAPRRETGIRLFDEIINLTLGGASRSEAVGLTPVDLIVVETDGSLEQVDSLKVAYPGAPATGLNVFDHPVDEALRHPGIRARQRGLAGLCAACRACPVVKVCGGGLFPHRYRPGTGFANPSVYCADLRRLIDHIVARLRTDIAARRAAISAAPAVDA
jgi:uncharacterized protein